MTQPAAEQKKQRIAALFGRVSATYDQIGPQFFSYFGRKLAEFAGIEAGMHILDIASGRGAVAFAAAEQVGSAGSVSATDISQGMIASLEAEIGKHGVGNLTVRLMDAENLDFPDAAFNAVTCGFGIFFFPDSMRAAAEFRRVLKPGGVVAISTWQWDDERWAWLDELNRKYSPAPETMAQPSSNLTPPGFDKADGLHTFFMDAGFTDIVVEADTAEFFYRDAEEWWAVQWSLGARMFLEQLSPEALDAMQQEAFRRLAEMTTPEGIPHRMGALYTRAHKPK